MGATAGASQAAKGAWEILRHWLAETYGSSEPERVLAFEYEKLRIPGWCFFYGSLNVPSHGGAYAVAVHAGRIWQGEEGLTELVRDLDLYSHPNALSVDTLALAGVFFLSHFGRRDARLIREPSADARSYRPALRRRLQPPRRVAEADGWMIEFWYEQRTLIRVRLHIMRGNVLRSEQQAISA